jgi:ferrous iron transport protein B
LWLLVGLALNRIIPGKSTGLVMEMFPFRRPHLGTIVKKTWYRFKSFVFMAAPILIGGSVLLGALFQTGHLFDLSRPLAPVVEGWMGLPAVTGLALVMAVLRKELALQLLASYSCTLWLLRSTFPAQPPSPLWPGSWGGAAPSSLCLSP